LATRDERFSRRQGHEPQDAPIRIRHEAPAELREAVVQIAYEVDLGPKHVRAAICQLLRRRPDPSNWSDFPNVDGEVHDLIEGCEWFEVYDIIEELCEYIRHGGGVSWGAARPNVDRFSEEINRYFRREGIGWQLVGCRIEARGEEAFETSLETARSTLKETGRGTAENEIHQARLDLSRRPEPDITGAIQHSLAGLEAVARDVTGNPKATLGEILKKQPDLVPPPLDQCIEKAWGYASEFGRHLREGRKPSYEEAELLVGLAATVVTYLVRRDRNT
jgi:hypothetical protein